MKNFECEEIVMSTTYFISEHFKIISKHRKKRMDFQSRCTNRNPPVKKLAGIFGKFFLFYIVFNMPVRLREILLCCCRMLFMM